MQSGFEALTTFSNLVRALYASMSAPAPWEEFLSLLRNYVAAKHAVLIFTPPNTPGLGTMINPTAAPSDIRTYLDHFLGIDPFTNLPEGRVVAQNEHIPDELLRRTAYFREWLQNIDGSNVLGLDTRSSIGFELRLRLVKPVGGAPFTEEERARVELLAPHLKAALEIYQKDEMLRAEQAVNTGAIEQCSLGAIILDHTNQIVKINEVAAAVLKESDGLTLVNNRLVLSSAAKDARFRQILSNFAFAESSAVEMINVDRPSGRRDILIAIRPVAVPNFMHTGAAPAVALFLSDPERQGVVTAKALRKVLPLTPTEAEISAALANGYSVTETCGRLGIAETTVRSHLRSVFAKTGVTRQSQLVRLIHSSLPEIAIVKG